MPSTAFIVAMLRILKAYGIPEELVNAIAKIYENTQALVSSPDGETDWFEIPAGVLQGDALAPYLFTIVLVYTMRQALKAHGNPAVFTVEPRKRRRHPAITVSELDFADDIVLILNHTDEAQSSY